MFRNYFKVALRNIKNQPGLSMINISGLTIGMACFILFLTYALHEFKYDQFHEDHERIYRMYRWSKGHAQREESKDVYLPMPMGKAIQADFPEIEKTIRYRESWGDEFVRINDQTTRRGLAYADPDFFKVFNFPIIYGNKSNPLSNIENIVLSKQTALDLFGEENPTGKKLEIQIDGKFTPFVITAIADDVPSYSSIQFNMLGSFEFLENHTQNGQSSRDNWNRSSYWVFAKVKEGSNLSNNSERLQAMRNLYYPDEERRYREEENWDKPGSPVTYAMQPIASMHTDFDIGWNSINPKKIWLLLALSFAVLLIACINFTTLAIGRSARRAKEVGIRKVIGSFRHQLVGQFLLESVIMASIALILGFLIANLLFPSFKQLAGTDMTTSIGHFSQIYVVLLLVTLLCGLLAGSYPALVLSGFRPIEILKSKIKLGGANYFMKSLIVFQFILSTTLIISTFVILKQLNFLHSAYPGFQKENVIVVDARGTDTEKNYPVFRSELINNPNVSNIAASELSIGPQAGWSRSGWDYKGDLKQVFEYFVDEHYIDLMNINLIAGRSFSEDIKTDVDNSVIINEAMAEDFGWTIDEAVGQELLGYHESDQANPVVIGVVEDFNFRPLSEEVKPQMFHRFADYQPQQFFVKIKAGDPTVVLADLEKVWQNLNPQYPFKFSFLEEDIDRFYIQESRFSGIITWAGGISIFLACLGLLGLSALASSNRKKEIGIRKVLGADLTRIVFILSKEFMVLVLISVCLAIPLGWYFMQDWLENFAYHIQFPWFFLGLAAVAGITISFVTIGIQCLKAGMAHPVDSLRNE